MVTKRLQVPHSLLHYWPSEVAFDRKNYPDL